MSKLENKIQIRNSVRILLINQDKELLLMCVDDPKTTSKDGKYRGRFWTTLGGGIEPSESIVQAVARELHEESGISQSDVEIGPVVWIEELEIILYGSLTRIVQQFIVVHTKKKSAHLKNLTELEKEIVKEVRWFSLDQIKSHNETIFPIGIENYLPEILDGKYPEKPIEINIGKEMGE